MLLLGLAAGTDRARAQEYAEDPVFFRDPDAATRARIRAAFDLLEESYASDHTRGREELVRIGYWSVEPLRRLIYEGNFTQVRNAALVLGTILDPRGLPDLVKVTRESRQQSAPLFSALMIGKFRDPATLDMLWAMIRERNKPPRRKACVLSIAKIHDKRSYDLLVDVIRLEGGNVVGETALFCLGFFRDRALVRGETGEFEPCEPLRLALKSRDEDTRRSALLALALVGHRQLKAYYVRFASDVREENKIRRIAILALGRFPDKDVTALLLRILKSPQEDSHLKEVTALVLKDRKDPTVRADLLRFHPESTELRAAATLALSNFDDLEAAKKIIGRLLDPNAQVRDAAAIGLSRLTDPEAKELAIRRLTEVLRAGPLDKDVKHDMQLARDILQGKETNKTFRWVGNRAFAEDMPKDIEEKILDFVNQEVERILDVSSLTDIKAVRPDGRRRFRINDETSDLRDLEEYLASHPYFEPEDIPEPEVAITPKVLPPPAPPDGEKGAEAGSEKREGK